MPTVSALDPSVRYDDQDVEQAQIRARNQDFMMRQWLHNQQMQAQRGMQENLMGAQERMFSRELADRAAGRTSQYGIQQLAGNQAMDLARLNQGPQQAALDFLRQKYTDERGDTKGERDWKDMLMRRKMGIADQIFGPESQPAQMAQPGQPAQMAKLGQAAKMAKPGQAATPAAGPSPFQFNDQDKRALAFNLFGMQAPTDPAEQAKAFMRQLIAAKMSGADESDLGKYAEAYKSGNLGAIPVHEKSAIDPGMLQEAIQRQVTDFGARDAAWIGFNPTETDVQDILKRRDQLMQAYIASERLPAAQAKQRANFVIEEALRPNQDRWGTEWIARLRQALNESSSPEPKLAAQRATPFFQ